jgi:hypothetical protein
MLDVVNSCLNAVILLAETVILCVESIKILLLAFEILLQSQVPFVHAKRAPIRAASSHFDARLLKHTARNVFKLCLNLSKYI